MKPSSVNVSAPLCLNSSRMSVSSFTATFPAFIPSHLARLVLVAVQSAGKADEVRGASTISTYRQ